MNPSDPSSAGTAACVLRYDNQHHSAPVLSGKGTGEFARRIVEVARDSGVPVVTDPSLAEALSFLPVDREIPPNLYRSLATIFAMIARKSEG